MSIKPILFNTDMVRGLLDGTKTVTRRVVKPHYRAGEAGFRVVTNKHTGEYVRIEIFDEWEDETRWLNEPYRPGDILYVPQPWKCYAIWDVMGYEVEFQDGEYVKFEFTDPKRAHKWAKYLDKPAHQWQSPYFMPREAARIFLRVTGVRVERLLDITEEDLFRDFCLCREAIETVGRDALAGPFWDSTIKPADRELYGWAANPWVRVIEFERCERPKGD